MSFRLFLEAEMEVLLEEDPAPETSPQTGCPRLVRGHQRPPQVCVQVCVSWRISSSDGRLGWISGLIILHQTLRAAARGPSDAPIHSEQQRHEETPPRGG